MIFLDHFVSYYLLSVLLEIFTIVAAFSLKGQHQQTLRFPVANANFSVGFSLQSSFGAAAVTFEDSDGTIATFTRTYEAGYLYQQVMAKLSRKSSQHIAPPYEDNGDWVPDQPRQGARMALKAVGLPASYEVGVLAQVIQNLRTELELEFGISISEAVFTSFHLLALYQDDLEDVAENVVIEYVVPTYQFKPIFWETASAYAGHGLGMCKDWRNKAKLPKTLVLAVHYSRNAISVSLAEIKTALGTWEPDYRHVENFILGADSIRGHPNSDQYWVDIRKTLLEVMRKYPGFHKPKIIIVTGDAVDENFLHFLGTTMYDYLGLELPILSSDATIAAAKGAAELMRRSKSCDDRSPPDHWPPGKCWSQIG